MSKKEENKKKMLEGEVDRTLSFLDGNYESIDGNSSFFYTKLMGRIRSEESESMLKSLKGAIILPALLVLILLFNFLTMIYNPDEGQNDVQISSPNDISVFIEKYHLEGR